MCGGGGEGGGGRGGGAGLTSGIRFCLKIWGIFPTQESHMCVETPLDVPKIYT